MAIQSFTCFHINFLLHISGAATYLTLRRRLLAEILTSLGCFQVGGHPPIHLNDKLITFN